MTLILATIALAWMAVATVFVAACVAAARADRRVSTRAIRAHRTITLTQLRPGTDRTRFKSLA